MDIFGPPGPNITQDQKFCDSPNNADIVFPLPLPSPPLPSPPLPSPPLPSPPLPSPPLPSPPLPYLTLPLPSPPLPSPTPPLPYPTLPSVRPPPLPSPHCKTQTLLAFSRLHACSYGMLTLSKNMSTPSGQDSWRASSRDDIVL